MATTSKNTTNTKTKTETPVSVPEVKNDNIDLILKENEALKSQMSEMQNQIQLMMQAMAQQTYTPVSKPDDDRYITFINLTPGTLGLKGSVSYKIEGQFASRNFLKSEAKLIVNNMPNTVRDGYVYIADADFLRECQIDYTGILSTEQLKTILSQNPDYVVSVYTSATEVQKKIILDMIVDKRINGQEVDANILMKLGQIADVDLLGIEPLTEE